MNLLKVPRSDSSSSTAGPCVVVAQQVLQPGAVSAFDAHPGIRREAPAVVPVGHVARIGLVQMTGACEPAQHAPTHLPRHRGEQFGCQRASVGSITGS